MDRIVCQGPCGESKPEIAFELNRSGSLRKKCRECRYAESYKWLKEHGKIARPGVGRGHGSTAFHLDIDCNF